MDGRLLKYFYTIVECGGITKASEKLMLAQPYLSRQLKLLESELGVKLIERTTRSLRVTEEGMILARRARQILELSEAAEKELRDVAEGVNGTLRIGCVSSAFEPSLAEKIQTFHEQYANVNYDVRIESSNKILELLKHGAIDIGIVRSPAELDGLGFSALPSKDMVVVSSESMNECCGSITLERLSETPLLLHRKYRNTVAESFRSHGLEPRIICEVDDTRPLIAMAERGIGAAVVPRDWAALDSSDVLKKYDIPELGVKSQMTIAWAKGRYVALAAIRFIELFGVTYEG